MDGYIKQSIAHTFQMGPFLDETNGKDAETALTIAATAIFLSKHGAAAAAKNDATALTGTGDARGYYDCVLNTTDVGTVGCLKVMAHISGALPVWHTFQVLPANVYDSFVAATDKLQVDIDEIDGDAPAAANLNSACDNYSATRGLTGTALPAAASNAAGGVPVSAGGALALDTQLENTHEITAARMGALTDWINAGRLDAILDGIKAVTDVLPNAGALTDIDGGVNALETRLVGTVAAGTHNPQSGDSFARIGATGSGLTSLALASVVGGLADAAAAGEVTSADTLMQYLKQLINILVGIPGIVTFPAEAAPGNGVSLSEVIRAIHADVTGLNGATMVGTNSAALASVCTETRLAELDAGNLPTDISSLNDIAAADVWDAVGAITSISFETLLERAYEMISNRMTVNETTGAVALRNIGNSADVATGNVASSSGTTTRAELSWV